MVGLRVTGAGGAVEIAVSDQGPGIAPADQERIFQKFERLDMAEAGGSGLGLYISRQLARAMGGALTVESQLGAGAVFKLRLKAATLP
ncbi:MAG: sensor histidine kinase [Chakrabartia sp.]